MNNQDNPSGWPLDMHQLKWALRHGQKIEGLENMMIANQPIMSSDNRVNNKVESMRIYNTSNSQINVHRHGL